MIELTSPTGTSRTPGVLAEHFDGGLDGIAVRSPMPTFEKALGGAFTTDWRPSAPCLLQSLTMACKPMLNRGPAWWVSLDARELATYDWMGVASPRRATGPGTGPDGI
jgi:hypothetical protein